MGGESSTIGKIVYIRHTHAVSRDGDSKARGVIPRLGQLVHSDTPRQVPGGGRTHLLP